MPYENAPGIFAALSRVMRRRTRVFSRAAYVIHLPNQSQFRMLQQFLIGASETEMSFPDMSAMRMRTASRSS